MRLDALDHLPDVCAICSGAVPLVLDHDWTISQGRHPTRNSYRGWLCNRCNIGLHLIEQPGLLERAQAYLAAPPLREALCDPE